MNLQDTQTLDVDLVKRLTENNEQLYAEREKALLSVRFYKNRSMYYNDYCDELERGNELKIIALIFVTTLLIVSLVGNAIQFFA